MWDLIFGLSSDLSVHLIVGFIALTILTLTVVGLLVRVKNLDDNITRIMHRIAVGLYGVLGVFFGFSFGVEIGSNIFIHWQGNAEGIIAYLLGFVVGSILGAVFGAVISMIIGMVLIKTSDLIINWLSVNVSARKI